MILTGFHTGHRAQSPCLTKPCRPDTHMGAIICKVAVVAPENHLNGAGVTMYAFAVKHTTSICLLHVITHTSARESLPRRTGDMERFYGCSNQKLKPTPLFLKMDYLFKYCTALKLNAHKHIYLSSHVQVKL